MWQSFQHDDPGGEAARRLLASTPAHAEPQVALLNFPGKGPTNPRPASLAPAELRRFNPTGPENVGQPFTRNGVWRGDDEPALKQDVVGTIAR